MCTGGPGVCNRAASMVSLELFDAVADVTMLSYASDQTARHKTVFIMLAMRLMCLFTAKLNSSPPAVMEGRYLKPVKNLGNAKACKQIHSPSSDHRELEAKYVWQPMVVGVHLTPGRTSCMSRQVAVNHGVLKWWCTTNAKCCQDPNGELAKRKNKETLWILQPTSTCTKPNKDENAALGERPPICRMRLHHALSLSLKETMLVSL